MHACHLALNGTRGAALTVVRLEFATGMLHWVGVGNVAAAVVHVNGPTPGNTLRLWAGVVGHRIPAFRPELRRVGAGDLIIVATDGVAPGFHECVRPYTSAEQVASTIMRHDGRSTDDALVAVLRVPAELG